MKIVKKMTLKMKAVIGLVLAGIVFAVVAFKRYVTDGLTNGELDKQEAVFAEESAKKLADQQAALEAQKVVELEALKKKEEVDRKSLEVKAASEKEKLQVLARKDKKAFKSEVEKRLGVREKKTPGRKPKGK